MGLPHGKYTLSLLAVSIVHHWYFNYIVIWNKNRFYVGIKTKGREIIKKRLMNSEWPMYTI